jgi:pimeloyl-ACP methyl ester carboxylesterase
MALRAPRVIALAVVILGLVSSETAAAADAVAETGVGADGAAFLIEIPGNWNGTLVLYSHGYVAPGHANPATDAGDPVTRAFLLAKGYALAGSAYASTGWAVKGALRDQIDLLDHFTAMHGKPKRTIAWGHSLGGMITAGLVQRDPQRFAGALPMCGVLAGGVGVWNSALDGEFVFKTLLAPNDADLHLVNITDPFSAPQGNVAEAFRVLGAAQATPQGRARLALAAAVGDLPGWFDPLSAEPAANEFASRLANQIRWDQNPDFVFSFGLRAELEARAGGNPSWNTDVDYRKLLDRSVDRAEVRALYATAGLDLEQDLDTLRAAPRIAADPAAVDYLTQNIVFNGDLGGVPVLTMHTTGDGLVANQDEQAYASIVEDRELLRQVFVHRAGHCTFTPAETVAAFNALIQRIDTGEWSGLSAAGLNNAAAALPQLNVFFSGPSFVRFRPTVFLRPFSVDDEAMARE